jgi:hypothetical protein
MKTLKIEEHPMIMDRKNRYCENDYTTKSKLMVQCNPSQNSNNILHGDRKVNPNIHMEAQKTLNSQRNPEQKEQCCELS